ncbi:c-type cytochrome [Paracoccaceae bacterium GXU_MW_L88]
MRNILAATLIALPATVFAQDAFESAVEARQSFFTLLGANMGALSGMARGEVEYDEEVAAAHAANIEALTQYGVPMHFVEGSSVDDLGDDETEARPEIWSDREGFEARFAALGEAAAGASEAVRGGQENVGPVLQQLGGACKACHDDYRAN